ncbi:MAG TPA: hypothetical protein VJG83_03865 [archaeon]|nr:hypothetical protein [archaeon]
MKKALLLFAILIFAGIVLSHENGSLGHENNSLFFLGVGFAITIIVVILSIIFLSKLSETHKHIAFIIIVLSISLSTLYLVGATVQKNLDSVTGGPVHWHADYEVWMCGEKLVLEQSKGIDGKIGTNLLHHHNDYRIHVEGTVMDLHDVSLGHYFEVIGGYFDSDRIAVVLEDGSILDKKNGDLCNGLPAKVQLYVNGQKNEKFEDHVLAPYSQIPPGDFIQIVFDSKEGAPNGS